MWRLSFQKARFLEQPRRGRGTDESQGRRCGVPAIPPIRRFRGPSLAALKNVPSGAKDATCYGQIHNYPPIRRKETKCAYRVLGGPIPSVPCVKPLQSSSGRSLVDHPKCRDEEGCAENHSSDHNFALETIQMPSFWEYIRLDVLHVPGVATRVMMKEHERT